MNINECSEVTMNIIECGQVTGYNEIKRGKDDGEGPFARQFYGCIGYFSGSVC